jgi:hypothetical protein
MRNDLYNAQNELFNVRTQLRQAQNNQSNNNSIALQNQLTSLRIRFNQSESNLINVRNELMQSQNVLRNEIEGRDRDITQLQTTTNELNQLRRTHNATQMERDSVSNQLERLQTAHNLLTIQNDQKQIIIENLKWSIAATLKPTPVFVSIDEEVPPFYIFEDNGNEEKNDQTPPLYSTLLNNKQIKNIAPGDKEIEGILNKKDNEEKKQSNGFSITNIFNSMSIM